MVHVRKVNGEAEIFGNQGALFMNAMTWWDHTTSSVWSQVWGRAIDGPLKGAELELLPSQVIPWGSWKEQYPTTLLMYNDLDRFAFFRGEPFSPDYVIGIALEGHAKSYPYRFAEKAGIVNDMIGALPVLVHVNPETRAVSTYLRVVDDQTLSFDMRDDDLVDLETGSTWNPINGLATDGRLKGLALRPVPYVPAFRHAWYDFHPQTDYYEGE